jgi:aminopeptidase YwaD
MQSYEVMVTMDILEKAKHYMRFLCVQLPNRRVGSEGNQKATSFFAEQMESFGFHIETQAFDCIDWAQEGSSLVVNGEPFSAFISPYSLGCRVKAPLVAVDSIEGLEEAEVSGNILLLHGEIAKEQVMPKNFPFYNPEHHQHIIRTLEEKAPLAIVAATARNPELAGGMYPFPLIEDGDFDIPSVYLTDVEGERLLNDQGEIVSLEIDSTRIPATGCNVVARKKGATNKRIVLCAHIDAKDGTPGALDNGTGVAVLLLLGELLDAYSGRHTVEIVALNGEDHYSAQGQKEYIKRNTGRFDEILLNINIDVAGYKEGKTAYSFYNLPSDILAETREVFAKQADTIEGEPWFQSDHMIFVQNQVPAVAITSDQFMELSTHITHTPKDNLDLVDNEKLVILAQTLNNLLNTI